jgi:ABC-type transport system involved in multi-copper enzyme maturation permease subunit
MNLNPVFINELRQSIFRRKPLLGIALWGAVSAFLLWLSQFTGSMSQMVTLLPILILPIIVPAISAGVFAKEYEQQTWQDLYLTRLTNFQVVSGKFCASLLLSWLITLSFVPAIQLTMMQQGQYWAVVPGWWMVVLAFKLLLSAALYVLVVMVCSRYSSTRRTALVWSYISLFLYALFNWFLWTSVGEMMSRSEFDNVSPLVRTQVVTDPMGPGFMQGMHLIFCTVIGSGSLLLLWVSLSEQRGYKGGKDGEARRSWQPIATNRRT